ncbi:MAG: hypothetical protein FGM33_06220 [Candidatus Kapabacteria bacterium]|nr:hypothetical protein [Candidatus Kapabacteria bacterium]
MNTPLNNRQNSNPPDEFFESEILLRDHIRRSVETHDDPIFTIDVMRAVMQESRKPSLLKRLWSRTPMIGLVVGLFTLGFISGNVAASQTNYLELLQSIPWSSLANSTLTWVAAGAAIFGLGVWQMER